MAQVVKLRQEQQDTKARLKAMEDRLHGNEQKQQQMVTFLARVLRNPEFLKQLIAKNEMRKQLHDTISKKRRRRIDQGTEADHMGASSSLQQESPILFDPHVSMELLADGSVQLLADDIPPDLEGSGGFVADGIPPDMESSVEHVADGILPGLEGSVELLADGIPPDLEGSLDLLADGIPLNLEGSMELLADGIPSGLEGPGIKTNGVMEPHGFDLGICGMQQNRAQGVLKDNFWDDLLNEELGDEDDNPVIMEDMNLLSEKMGYLVSDTPTPTK